MRIKFCGIRNESDLAAALTASPDAVGFLVGQVHPSPDFILGCTARRLARILPPFVQPWLVTHFSKPEDVLELAAASAIPNIQLHGDSTPEQVSAIREALPPNAKLIVAVHPDPQDSFAPYAEYIPFIDAYLVDTFDPATGRVGGTGIPGCWPRAARFVLESPRPVILAGGLTPLNVAKAIARVRPFAVDVNTGVKDPAGRSENGALCRAFARAARQAAF